MDQFEQVARSLGQNLAQRRKALKLTQKQLAVGICSQSMVSSIEKGTYVPNAILLSELCQRLGISMEHSLLSDYYGVQANLAFTQQIEMLCNQHQYDKLLAYMDQPGMLNQLYLNEDLQRYYYYHGCAVYQAKQDSAAALQDLRLALSYTYSKRNVQLTAVESLILSAVNFIECESGQATEFENFDLVLTALQQKRISQPDENLNSVFYQYGLALLHQKEVAQSINILEKGVTWATAHNANFMLADFFFLLSQEYQAVGNQEQAKVAQNRYQVMLELFKQPVNRKLD